MAKDRGGKVYIGTSGWVYKGWNKTFYPEDLPAKDQFRFYTTLFPTVEINATFYRLPTKNMVKGWRDRAPEGFVFAVKGSRFITHILKIQGVAHGVNRYFTRIKPLAARIDPVLWQLPPFLKQDLGRLKKFLGRLPSPYRHALEFRHESWFNDDTYAVLREHNAALVWVSTLKFPPRWEVVTADFVYVRFHGLEGGPYHDYQRSELRPWAQRLRDQAAAGRKAYVYFNNDLNVRAPDNARQLMDLLGDAAVRTPAAK